MEIGTQTRTVISTGKNKKDTRTGMFRKTVQVVYHTYIGKHKDKQRFSSVTRHELI